MTAALSISHLRKVYKRGTVAVDDLTLEIKPGDFFGFLGPNGAGKSTTIHCVTGIATVTSGTIEIFGVDAVKNYREARRQFEIAFIKGKLREHDGNITKTAAAIGLHRQSLQEKLRELGIQSERG